MMSEETQDARDALAVVDAVGERARLAAHRAVAAYMLGIGAAMAAAVLLSGLVGRWGDGRPSWERSLADAALWVALAAAVATLANAGQVRTVLARGKAITTAVVGGIVVGASLAVGGDHLAALPIGAAVVFGVWLLGAAWVRR
jgi:hypothetical protein